MDAFGQEIKSETELPDIDTVKLRVKLIKEEVEELQCGIENNDIVNTAKELADILYVVYGAGASFGIDLDAVFKEVHESNMSKLGHDGKPIYREDGKVMKGPSYYEPDIDTVLFGECAIAVPG